MHSPRLDEIRTFRENDEVYDFDIIEFLDGKKGIVACCRDSRIMIFSEEKCLESEEYDNVILSVYFIRETKQLLTTDFIGKVTLWDVFPSLKVSKIAHVCVEESRLWKLNRVSEKYFVCCTSQGNCEGKIFKISFPELDVKELVYVKKTEIVEDKESSMPVMPVDCICQLRSRKELILFGGGDYLNGKDFSIHLYNWKYEKSLEWFDSMHTSTVICVATYSYNEQKERIISGASDFSLIVWNLEGKVLQKIKLLNSPGAILVSQSLHFAVVSDYFGVLYYSDLTEEILEFDPIKRLHSSNVYKLDFIPDSGKLVSCSTDGAVSIHKLRSKKYFFPIELFEKSFELKSYHAEWIFDILVIPKYNILVTCSRDWYIRFFDLSSKKEIASFKHTIRIFNLLFWEEMGYILFTDGDVHLSILELKLGYQSVEIKKNNLRLKLGELKNSFECVIQYKKTNRFITCCSSGNPNCGELKQITIDGKYSSVKILCKLEVGIESVRFSLVNSDILYFGGGDSEEEAVKDFKVRKFSFSDLSICGEYLKENDKKITGIYSILRKSKEYIIIGNVGYELYIFTDSDSRNEFMKKVKMVGGYPYYFSDFNDSTLLIGSEKSISFLDLETLESRILGFESNVGAGGKFVHYKEENLVISCCNVIVEGKMESFFSVQFFYILERDKGYSDEDERIEYLRMNYYFLQEENRPCSCKVKLKNSEFFCRRFFLSL